MSKQLWELIESFEWVKDHDYERIGEICKNLPKDDFKNLEDFICKKINLLHKKFDKDWLGNPGIDCGDDSWGDLLAEVVGRGENFYKSITSDKLRDMVNNDDYEECFTYCLHID
jgi:hypothetical protein